MTRRNRLMRAVALASLALILAGCASIPGSGPVKQGAVIAQGDNQSLDLDFNPSPPVDGASQDDLLHGFIDAASSPRNGYAIAREYLTPRLASRWNPDESVTVDQGTGRSYTAKPNSTWQLGVSPVATVDSIGGYHQSQSASPVTLTYRFEKVGKEWRIAVAPNGVVLDSSTFNSVFAPQDLYFYSPNFAYLVPDQRWFPARASTATRITKALLAGPSKWLAGAVVSAFPTGTQLRVDAVTTSASTAQLDLTSEAGQADTVTLQRMKLELAESLSSQVTSVQLSIEGTPQTIGSLSDSNIPSTSQPIDSHPVVFRDGSYGLLSGSSVTPISGISDKVAPLQPIASTLTANRQSAAVLATDGVHAIRAQDGAPTVVDNRPGLIAPAIDNYGYVWTVPADDPSAIRVTGPDGTAHVLKSNWSSATRIQSLEISRDGTRALALLQTGSTWSLVVTGVVRGASDLPVSVNEPLVLGLTGNTPVSAAWVDQLSVVVLSQSASGSTTIEEQQIGGSVSSLAGPAQGTMVVGSGGVAAYVALTSAGSLEAPTGGGWQALGDKIGSVATQMGIP